MTRTRRLLYRSRRYRAVEAQVMILFAVALVALLGFVALSIDVGFLFAERRQVQSAVDAGALAAVQAALARAPAADVTNAAKYYGARNAGVPESQVVVNRPPVDGPHAGNNNYIQVTITKEVQRFFLDVVYRGDWQVSATAVAGIEPEKREYALIVLGRNGNPFRITGNPRVTVEGAGAVSNAGMQCIGNARLTVDTVIDVHTTFSQTGNCRFVAGVGTMEGAPQIEDPLRHVLPPPKPVVSPASNNVSCTQQIVFGVRRWTCPAGHLNGGGAGGSGNGIVVEFSGGHHSASNFNVDVSGNSPRVIFNPGTYHFVNSHITLSGNNAQVVFNPGRYVFYMDGGSLTLHGNSQGYQHTSGTYVEFYFRNSNVDFVGNNTGSIPPGIYYFEGRGPRLTGNQKVNGENVFFYFDKGAGWTSHGNTRYEFTAWSTPQYTGMQPNMLFFSARDNDATFSLHGNAGSALNGIVYLPAARLDLVGNADGTWAEGQLIVREMTVTGNGRGTIRWKDGVLAEIPRFWLVQ